LCAIVDFSHCFDSASDSIAQTHPRGGCWVKLRTPLVEIWHRLAQGQSVEAMPRIWEGETPRQGQLCCEPNRESHRLAARFFDVAIMSSVAGKLFSVIAVVLYSACGNFAMQGQQLRAVGPKRTPVYTYQVIRTFAHDPAAFTQGLAYKEGFLYEGTGLYGGSSLRKVKLQTGEILQQIKLQPSFFGEGITILGDRVVQLTYQSQTGLVYSLNDFHLLRQFSYSGEGWGLTTDGHDFFMSDGTDEIRVLDSQTFKEKRRFVVRDGNEAIDRLNELEFVEGEIFANVWQTDRIARISPRTGKVVGWIDLSGILSAMYRTDPGAIPNGIAYDPVHKRLFVTGKLWPRLFEIRLVPRRTD